MNTKINKYPEDASENTNIKAYSWFLISLLYIISCFFIIKVYHTVVHFIIIEIIEKY